MRRNIARIKGVGYLLWHSRHEFYHILLGLVWAWFLRERWNEFNFKWITWSIIGSLLPDLDHFVYFFGYGKKETYTQQIIRYIKTHEWRNLISLIETGHKENTNLMYHNIYTVIFLFSFALVSSFYEWRIGVILFGSMIIHYCFDIADDIVTLGYVNNNWKRLGRRKK